MTSRGTINWLSILNSITFYVYSLYHYIPIILLLDDKYLVQTPEDGNFLTHFIPANDFLMFGVKACSDARIKLNAVPSYDDKEIVKTGYTVTIGEAGNTKSSIHPTGTSDGQVKSTPSKQKF